MLQPRERTAVQNSHTCHAVFPTTYGIGYYVTKKILIVEDETDLVKLLKYNLEKEGFRVNYATDGSVAMAEARRDPPDLVILDVMLPGLDGLEICRQLRRNDRFV